MPSARTVLIARLRNITHIHYEEYVISYLTLSFIKDKFTEYYSKNSSKIIPPSSLKKREFGFLLLEKKIYAERFSAICTEQMKLFSIDKEALLCRLHSGVREEASNQ